MGLLWQALYRFFVTLNSPLNKGERDQPAPLDVQERHLREQLARVEAERASVHTVGDDHRKDPQ